MTLPLPSDSAGWNRILRNTCSVGPAAYELAKQVLARRIRRVNELIDEIIKELDKL